MTLSYYLNSCFLFPLPKKEKLFTGDGDNSDNSVNTLTNLSTSKNIDFNVEEEKETRNPMSFEAKHSTVTKIIEINNLSTNQDTDPEEKPELEVTTFTSLEATQETTQSNNIKLIEDDNLPVIPEIPSVTQPQIIEVETIEGYQSSLSKLPLNENVVENDPQEKLVASVDNCDVTLNPKPLLEVCNSSSDNVRKKPAAKPKKKRKKRRIPLNMPKSSSKTRARFIDCQYKFETYTKARAYKNSPANIALRKLPNISQAVIITSAKRKVNRQRKRSLVAKDTPLSRSHNNRSLKRSLGNISGGSEVAKRLEMTVDCDVAGDGNNETGKSVCTNCSTNVVDETQSPETPIEKLLCQQCVCALNQHNKTHLLANKTTTLLNGSPHRGSLKSRINRKRKKPTISKLVEARNSKQNLSSSDTNKPEPEPSRQLDVVISTEQSSQLDPELEAEQSRQSSSSSTSSIESKSSSRGKRGRKPAFKGKGPAVSEPKPVVTTKPVATKNKKKKASPVKSTIDRSQRHVSIGSVTLLNTSSPDDGSSSLATAGGTRRNLRQRKTVNYKLSKTMNRALKALSSTSAPTKTTNTMEANKKDLVKNKKDAEKINGHLSVVDEVNESQETSTISANNKTSTNTTINKGNKGQQRKRKTTTQPPQLQTSKTSKRGAINTTKSTKALQEPMLMETNMNVGETTIATKATKSTKSTKLLQEPMLENTDETTTIAKNKTTRTLRKRKVAEKDATTTNNQSPPSPNKQSRITRGSAVKAPAALTQNKAPIPQISSKKGSTPSVTRKKAPTPARKATLRSSPSTTTTAITQKKESPTTVSSTKVSNQKKSSTSEESDNEVVLNMPKGFEKFGEKKNKVDKHSGKENICSSQDDGDDDDSTSCADATGNVKLLCSIINAVLQKIWNSIKFILLT